MKRDEWTKKRIEWFAMCERNDAIRDQRAVIALEKARSLRLAIPPNAILAWRAFGAPDSTSPGVLSPMHGTFPHEYQAGHPFVAACMRAEVEHEAPFDACECGIYATEAMFKSLAQPGRWPHLAGKYTVYGRVALWGRVLPAKNGPGGVTVSQRAIAGSHRAQYAYPVALYTTPTYLDACAPFCPTFPLSALAAWA